MKTKFINLINFLFNISEDSFVRDIGLVIKINYSLKIIISSEINIPDFVSVSIIEGSLQNKNIIKELIKTEDIKNIISLIWKKIEKNQNQNFILENGIEEYNKFYAGFIDALNGKKENKYFNFFIEKDEGNIIIIKAEDKVSKIISHASLNLLSIQNSLKIDKAAIFNALAILKINELDDYKWKTKEFAIYIPIVDLEKYPILNLSVKKNYEEKNILDYLQNQIKDENSKKLIASYILKEHLENNNNNNNNYTKRIKI